MLKCIILCIPCLYDRNRMQKIIFVLLLCDTWFESARTYVRTRTVINMSFLSAKHIGIIFHIGPYEIYKPILANISVDNTVHPYGRIQCHSYNYSVNSYNWTLSKNDCLILFCNIYGFVLQDPCFSALLQYSCENRAFLGCDPPASLCDF